MSDNVPPDLSSQSEPRGDTQVTAQPTAHDSLATLTRLVRHLGDELAGFRKRALSAESRVKHLEQQVAAGGLSPERSQELERENADLKARLEEAQQRTTALLERVRFLRQQHDQAGAV